MKLDLLGVRGSTAAPGPDFVRYGGHTSCVAVTHDGAAVPTLVLDAGTGLRTLTGRLDGTAFDGAILLSHLHWDHVQGLPFFAAGDRDDARVDLHLPAQDGVSGRDLLAQTLSPPAFPITPEGLRGAWGFHAWDGGTRDIEGFSVRAVDVAHKGGRTFAYRVERDGASLAYLPDHAPAAGMSAALLDLLSEVDLLVHDAQCLDGERLGVEVDERPVRSLGRGEGFGEIALLREGLRTATVTAQEACVLWSLEGDVFLAALRADAGRALAALDAVAEESLRRASPNSVLPQQLRPEQLMSRTPHDDSG